MDNNNMKTIKFLKNHEIKLNGKVYKPHKICELPTNFGCIEFNSGEGVSEWFNYKDSTYIRK